MVIRAKARSTVHAPTIERPRDAYQADEEIPVQPATVEDEQLDTLRDEVGEFEWVDEYSFDQNLVAGDEELDTEEVKDDEDEDKDEDKKEYEDEQSDDTE